MTNLRMKTISISRGYRARPVIHLSELYMTLNMLFVVIINVDGLLCGPGFINANIYELNKSKMPCTNQLTDISINKERHDG